MKNRINSINFAFSCFRYPSWYPSLMVKMHHTFAMSYAWEKEYVHFIETNLCLISKWSSSNSYYELSTYNKYNTHDRIAKFIDLSNKSWLTYVFSDLLTSFVNKDDLNLNLSITTLFSFANSMNQHKDRLEKSFCYIRRIDFFLLLQVNWIEIPNVTVQY